MLVLIKVYNYNMISKWKNKNDQIDTFNEAMSSMQTNLLLGNKTNNPSDFSNELLSVPRTRLELARTKRSLPPQSSVSTNFTTWAFSKQAAASGIGPLAHVTETHGFGVQI